MNITFKLPIEQLPAFFVFLNQHLFEYCNQWHYKLQPNIKLLSKEYFAVNWKLYTKNFIGTLNFDRVIPGTISLSLSLRPYQTVKYALIALAIGLLVFGGIFFIPLLFSSSTGNNNILYRIFLTILPSSAIAGMVYPFLLWRTNSREKKLLESLILIVDAALNYANKDIELEDPLAKAMYYECLGRLALQNKDYKSAYESFTLAAERLMIIDDVALHKQRIKMLMNNTKKYVYKRID